jgi:hypothetical protein
MVPSKNCLCQDKNGVIAASPSLGTYHIKSQLSRIVKGDHLVSLSCIGKITSDEKAGLNDLQAKKDDFVKSWDQTAKKKDPDARRANPEE